MEKYIVYYRVSTQKQGRSGLGLEAQKARVNAFIECKECIIAEFTDIETGKANDRPQLNKAISTAKKQGAKLLIAKLDRLSRNVGFIFQLRDSGVDFVCCDMPTANTLTIGMLATLAQYERELISERTKSALAAKKARGQKLGNPNGFTASAQAKATQTKRSKANTNTNTLTAKAQIKDIIQLTQFRNESITLQGIANKLNAIGIKTARGKEFTKQNIRYILKSVLSELNIDSLNIAA